MTCGGCGAWVIDAVMGEAEVSIEPQPGGELRIAGYPDDPDDARPIVRRVTPGSGSHTAHSCPAARSEAR